MDELVVRGVTIPERELEWSFSTSGGPGGQHANRSNTAAEVRFNPGRSTVLPDVLRERILKRLADDLTQAGDLIMTASDHRSQTRNRATALRRLQTALVDATAPPSRGRRPTKPSKGSRRRRLDAKARRGEIKRMRRRPDW